MQAQAKEQFGTYWSFPEVDVRTKIYYRKKNMKLIRKELMRNVPNSGGSLVDDQW